MDIPFHEGVSHNRGVHIVKLRPLNDKIVVKRLEVEDRTCGGIVLPDTAKEKPKRGTVIHIGNGRLLDNGHRVPLLVKEGDQVFFTSHAGDEIKINGQEYLILSESDVLGVME